MKVRCRNPHRGYVAELGFISHAIADACSRARVLPMLAGPLAAMDSTFDTYLGELGADRPQRSR